MISKKHELYFESMGAGPIQEIDDPPTLIGRCAREKSRGVTCGRKIFNNSDYEFIRADYLICEECCDDILTPYVEPQADSMGRLGNKNKVKGNTENHGKVFRNYKTRWEKK